MTPSTTSAPSAPAPPHADAAPDVDGLPAPPALPQPGALRTVPLPGVGGAGETETTIPSGGGSGPGAGGSGSTTTGSSGATPPTANNEAAGVTSTDVRGTGETLPLIGSAIVWLLAIGTALAATGGALARVARRRFS